MDSLNLSEKTHSLIDKSEVETTMCYIIQGKLLEGIRRAFSEETAFQLAFAECVTLIQGNEMCM